MRVQRISPWVFKRHKTKGCELYGVSRTDEAGCLYSKKGEWSHFEGS